jgi:Zn-dependent peptidase ImmA (M78 family)
MNVILQKNAKSFRERNGISSSEPIRIKSLLLKLNVFTMFKPLSENFSGMSLKVNEDSRFILINSNHSIGRQHFTIGHELYHLFEQDKVIMHQCMAGLFDSKNKEEYNADCFASFLLMPESGIYELIPDNELKKKEITIQTIIKLEQYFSVSHSSMLVRLKMLKLIDTNMYESHKNIKISKIAVQYGFDASLYRKGNEHIIIGSNYGEKAKQLFDKEIISEGHYLELMQKIDIDVTNIQDEYEN